MEFLIQRVKLLKRSEKIKSVALISTRGEKNFCTVCSISIFFNEPQIILNTIFGLEEILL